MYSALSHIENRKSKQETRQPASVSPPTCLNDQPETHFRPLQLFDRDGTLLCRRNDEVVDHLEFEISRRDRRLVRHAISSALSPF